MNDYFALKPYCTKCKKWADKRHKNRGGKVIMVSEEVLEAVEALIELGIGVHKASCYMTPYSIVYGKSVEYTLYTVINLSRHYPSCLFEDIPDRWKYYTETITPDKTPVQMLCYTETNCWDSYEDIQQRAKSVVAGFAEYMRTTRDKAGLDAVLTLMYS